jgi:V/A-type H+/Na+-transporting ATPase subunit I
MAIAEMTKVIIACFHDQANDLLEELQKEGIFEIFDAQRAMVSKEWPELQTEIKKPRDLEEMVTRLQKSIDFLKENAKEKDVTSVFRPLIKINKQKYSQVVSSKEAVNLLLETEHAISESDRLQTEIENKCGTCEILAPWENLELPVEQLRELDSATCFSGLLPKQHLDEIIENLSELNAAVEQVGLVGNMHACLVVCLNDAASEVQKVLRNGDFEAVSFEGQAGTVAVMLKDCIEQRKSLCSELEKTLEKACELATDRLSLQILFDHYTNLLSREQTRAFAPATENTILLEGWVKTKDFSKAEAIVGDFDAANIGKMDLAEDEEAPVEIDNNSAVRPFEVITRLYGMPSAVDVDPTVFLAPFFALFFGLCLTDAGYGIFMVAILWWILKKVQGDKGILWMMLSCSAVTIIAGALTGGWFGDALQTLVPAKFAWVNGFREKIMIFDPMTNPMPFFKLSIGLGYLQIMFGLLIAFFNNIKRKEYIAAICDQLSWLIFLNSLVLYLCSKKGICLPGLTTLFGFAALSQVFVIFFFTERKSGLAGRLGGGTFALFSTVFYLGDILSYVRLMALGMVTAGLGIAVNILVKLLMDVPYIGFILGAVLFVVGHLFNLAMSTLSSFVHSLRLQFVEFFPKFLTGSGREFKPMRKDYKHVMIDREP